MNLLFYSHTSNLGGAERSMLDMLAVLAKLHHIHVIIPNTGPLEKQLTTLNIKYSVIKYSWWAHGTKKDKQIYSESFSNILSSLKKVQELSPDIIITNTAVIPWGAITAKLLNIPHIWNIREFVKKDHQLIPEIGFEGLSQFIYEYSDKIFFVSESVKKEYEKYIPTDKSSVIYSQINIDPKLINQKINTPFKFDNSFKITIASSIAPNKDQKTAIKAINYLILKKYNVELLIIGLQNKQSPYFKEILSYVSNRIHLQNYDENPYPYFKLSNTLLVCSKNEALSRTIIEAGLLKIPTIVSNRGGNIELIKHKNNGLIYKYGDYHDLAKQIIFYIENESNKDKYANYNFELSKIKFSKSKIYESEIPKVISKIKPKIKIKNIEKFYQLLNIDKVKLVDENTKLRLENKIIKDSHIFKLWPLYNHIKKIFIK